MNHLLNTLLFSLGGLVWAQVIFEDENDYSIRWVDVGWLILFYLLVLAIRFIQVASIYPLFSKTGLRSNWQEAIFISYGK